MNKTPFKRVTEEAAAAINERVNNWNSDMFASCRASSKSAIREFLANEQGMSYWGKDE